MSIYAACHKKFDNPFGWRSSFYKFLKYIEVGAYYHDDPICDIRDNTGDSISEKNNTYNELTGQYWIFKNDHESDIVGLCHYRRYFRNMKVDERASVFRKLLKPHTIRRILKKHDFIAIKTGPFEMSCRDRIATDISGLRPKDIPLLRQIILEKSGETYAYAFDEILDRNWNYLYNMFISNKNLFDSYSAWLFEVVEELEKRVDMSELEGQEKRIIGLWGEYLFNVFVVANNYKVYDSDFIYFDI